MGYALRLAIAILLVAAGGPPPLVAETADWRYTEGAPGGGRYSPLTDIDKSNADRLEVAWSFRHGDFYDGGWRPDYINRGTSAESTPIVVDDTLYLTTPHNHVIALHPESGTLLWRFDPRISTAPPFANMIINRGVAYWRGRHARGRCARRIFLATLDARLIALDAVSGEPCAEFGEGGTVDLLASLDRPLVDRAEYNLTSPPTVVGDVVIVGSSVADLLRRVAPPGDVRGFDARSGKLLWTFHTIPRPGEPGHETWENDSWDDSGAANVWSTITADLDRRLVFLPVGSASPDFDGVLRPGANLYSDSVVALNSDTGELRWSFQTVHHDLWDYDLAAPPVLVRVQRDGRPVDAVAQATKSGFVFVLDRDNGTPLFPVEERPVPPSDVPGEHAWPTQPVPLLPPPLVPQRLTEDDLWDADPERLEKCRERLRELRNDGLFTPPSLRGSVLYPYTAGGANWSGAAFDPASAVLFVPVNNLVHVVRLRDLPPDNVDRDHLRVMSSVWQGLRFLWSGEGTGLRYFLSPVDGRQVMREDGVPCNRPPWGELVAVDLNSGAIRWRAPMGEKDGVRGLNGFGPPLLTASGLVFHAGTVDRRLRVHDSDSGAVLASYELPAGLHAGPITYRIKKDGPQYLVVAPGGHIGLGSRQGDYVIAYRLASGRR